MPKKGARSNNPEGRPKLLGERVEIRVGLETSDVEALDAWARENDLPTYAGTPSRSAALRELVRRHCT